MSDPADQGQLPEGLPTPEQMSTMPWATLLNLRNQYGTNQAVQDYIGPYEHQAYARETTQASPILGGLQMAVVTPAYSVAKGLGIINAARALGADDDDGTKQSQSSWSELAQGFKGIGQGLVNAVRGK
ncbi:MAG TPA: hypothetical protein VF798_08075 [Burkholderiaceae bacterium]